MSTDVSKPQKLIQTNTQNNNNKHVYSDKGIKRGEKKQVAGQ